MSMSVHASLGTTTHTGFILLDEEALSPHSDHATVASRALRNALRMRTL